MKFAKKINLKEHAKKIHKQGSEEQFFFTAFTFLNPENLNYHTTFYMTSAGKILFFQRMYIVLVQFIKIKTTTIILSCFFCMSTCEISVIEI